VRLSRGARASGVHVAITPTRLTVAGGGAEILAGELWRRAEAAGCGWQLHAAEGYLEVSLLKASRRGRYGAGQSNADTFWFAPLRGGGCEPLPGRWPPASYYTAPYEHEDAAWTAAVAAALPPTPRRAALPPAVAAASRA